MDDADIGLRFVETGRPPQVELEALRRLHDAHAVVLEDDRIRMLNPFSLVPTRWLERRDPGATIPVETLWRLAHAWYRDRLAPDWRPREPEENRAILRSLGLTGPFWDVDAE